MCGDILWKGSWIPLIKKETLTKLIEQHFIPWLNGWGWSEGHVDDQTDPEKETLTLLTLETQFKSVLFDPTYDVNQNNGIKGRKVFHYIAVLYLQVDIFTLHVCTYVLYLAQIMYSCYIRLLHSRQNKRLGTRQRLIQWRFIVCTNFILPIFMYVHCTYN